MQCKEFLKKISYRMQSYKSNNMYLKKPWEFQSYKLSASYACCHDSLVMGAHRSSGQDFVTPGNKRTD